jgi:hypothetical protein
MRADVGQREHVGAGERKLSDPVTLFAAIEASQHAALREIAFTQRRSMADVVREALTEYLTRHPHRPSV